MRRVWLLAALLLLLGGCDKPGEGVQAEAGYTSARPVIAALEQYRKTAGRYPSSLEELVPAHMKSVPEGPGGPFEYKLREEGTAFDLTFRYTGPGMNVCTYTPERQWHCLGYY